jgi:tellurite resistance protein TerC
MLGLPSGLPAAEVLVMVRETLHVTYRTARKIVIGVVGASVLALGVAMLVLPGPAFVVIPAGLAILSLEFAWARHWLRAVRARGQQAVDYVRNGRRAA